MTDPTVEFLTEEHPETAGLALHLRDVVRNAEPDFEERVYRGWDGIGFRHPDAGFVCAIYPQAEHVRLLFEHGRALQDPDGLLEGDGRQTRYVTVRAADPVLAAKLRDLVRAAVSERLSRRTRT